MGGPRRRSFIVRVIHEPPGRRFVVHDLKSGEVREFARWDELQRYLERRRDRRLR